MELYHCTDRKNLESILVEGLKPHRFPLQAKEGVYLSKDPFIWMFHATMLNRNAGAMLEVRVDGLELFPDKLGDATQGTEGENFFTRDVIPASRIVKVFVSSKDSPCDFREFKK